MKKLKIPLDIEIMDYYCTKIDVQISVLLIRYYLKTMTQA